MKMKNKIQKLIYGVGICDVTCVEENGKVKQSYGAWHSMLQRAYCPKYHELNQTYIGCAVAPEWLCYSEFVEFYDKYHRDGYQLDKDILVLGNKVYGPATCCFVPPRINSLLTKSDASRGKYMIGVCWDKQHERFRSACSVDGQKKHLGYFDTEIEAHEAYCRFKEREISRVALQAFKAQEIDLKVFVALLEYEVGSGD